MSAFKSFVILVIAVLTGSVANAQEKHEWKEATSPSAHKYRYVTNDPMQARFYTLKNGLTVILSPNHKEPRIQTFIAVRAGSNHDPSNHTGLAHYLEHLLFKGTYAFGSLDSAKEKVQLAHINELYDLYNKTADSVERKLIYRKIDSVSGVAAKFAISNEYDKLMAGMGAQGTNAFTNVEETVYIEDIPANAVDKFLTVQAERFRNPVFRLFHTELEAVYEEKNRSLDNDSYKMWEVLVRELFPTHNYGQQTTIGTVEHLKNPSLTAIRQFYEDYYVPGNMAIIMAGDFEPDDLIAKIAQAFSYMQPKPVKQYEGPQEKPIGEPVIREVVGPDAEQLLIGFRLPGIQSYQNQVEAMVVSQLLSNGSAGLIDIELNKQQKVLAASAGVEYWRDYSLFLMSGKAKEGQTLEQVKDLLLGQIDLLANGQFDETLIKAIVSNFKFYEISGLDNNINRVNSLKDGYIQHKGELWDKDVAFVNAMSEVSKEQVVKFVNSYLTKNYVAVFKRQGENKPGPKIEKPPITPVEMNRDVESDFVKQVRKIPENEIKPLWVDYKKDISKGRAGPADILFVSNARNDLFRLNYRIDVGEWHNLETGLAAQYLEFLGTDSLSAEEISRRFYNIACTFSITPGPEYTDIHITGLQENFNEATRLFENLIRNCVADEVALKNLKERIHKARADERLNKQAITRGLVNYAMYGSRNPFNYRLTKNELEAVTSARLVELLHNFFAYPHTIIYFGPQPFKSFVPAIKKLHRVPASFKPAPQVKKFSKTPNTANNVLFTPYDMVQSEIFWVANSDAYDTSRVPVIRLFNNYFGGSMASIVFQTIRESKALAYSTYASFTGPVKKDDRYSTIAYVGTQADKLADAVKAMNELLDSLPRTEALFESAKQSIRKDIASERILDDGIIFSYLAAKRLGLDYDLRKSVYRKVEHLTFADLKNFYDQTISRKKYTYGVIGAKDKTDFTTLQRLGDVKELSLDQLFGE